MEKFFFSSRRRHTRFDCDWSSDVCSSDLQRQFIACWCGNRCKCSKNDILRTSCKWDSGTINQITRLWIKPNQHPSDISTTRQIFIQIFALYNLPPLPSIPKVDE